MIIVFFLLLSFGFSQQCLEAQEIILTSSNTKILINNKIMKVSTPSYTGCNDFKQHHTRWFKIKNYENVPLLVNISYSPITHLHVVDSCLFQNCLLNSFQKTSSIILESESSVYLAFFTSTPPLQSTLQIDSSKLDKIKIIQPNENQMKHTTSHIKITSIPTSVFCGNECKISIPSQSKTIKIGNCNNQIKHISSICEDGINPLQFSFCSNGYITSLLNKNSGKCILSLSLDKETSISLKPYKEKTKIRLNNNHYEETIDLPKIGGKRLRNYEINLPKGKVLSINTVNQNGQIIKPFLSNTKSSSFHCNSNGVCSLFKKASKNEKVNIGIGLLHLSNLTKIVIHLGDTPIKISHSIPFTTTQPQLNFIPHQPQLNFIPYQPPQNTPQIIDEYKEGGSKQYVFISIGMVFFILVIGFIFIMFRPNSLFRLFN
ncbi:hypothetical protein, conserved [Entamoeba histolytica]